MKKSVFIIFSSLYFQISFAQYTDIQICNWPNNAKAAFSIVHDDFGTYNAQGIQNYADTICKRKNLVFTTAAIINECDDKDWEIAKKLISHGHQIVNHTMSHRCGVAHDWCMFGNWGPADFGYEIDSADIILEKRLGLKNHFMIFPFDLHTDTMISHLKEKKYWGARAGVLNEVNTLQNIDFLHLNFAEHFPQNKPDSSLNAYIKKTIQNQAWGIQTIHGVEDFSWGKLSLIEYQIFTDTLSKLQKRGTLYIGTLETITNYINLQKNTSLKQRKLNDKIYELELVSSTGNFTEKDEISLKINTKDISKITQNQTEIPIQTINNERIINIKPINGKIILQLNNN